jgi:hypothetical protein
LGFSTFKNAAAARVRGIKVKTRPSFVTALIQTAITFGICEWMVVNFLPQCAMYEPV